MGNELLRGEISSKEIIDKTGISRATLNNYIKLGILPKPRVGQAGSDQHGAKKIGYFPVDVLDRIKMVKSLKRNGESMQAIARKFRRQPETEISSAQVSPTPEPSPCEVLPVTSFPATVAQVSSKLFLTMDFADYPAYLVNAAHEIAWINKNAANLMMHAAPEGTGDLIRQNIFKFFLSNSFRESLDNWEEIIDLHLKILKSAQLNPDAHDIFEALSGLKTSMFSGGLSEVTDEPPLFKTIPIDFVRTAEQSESFTLHTLLVEQGVVFVYVPAKTGGNEIKRILARRGEEIMALPALHTPGPATFCVMVAILQDAAKICAELPPEEYLELVNEVWRNTGDVLKKYKGIFGKWVAGGAQYYFIKGPTENHAMNAVLCAIELRAMLDTLNRQWLVRKSWGNDLQLNIAINQGQEFSGTIWSSSNVEFVALGDSVGRTVQLAEFAGSGAIWATKDVVGGLTAEQRAGIRFGVHQVEQDRKIFIPNSFTRIVDVLGRDPSENGRFADIASLPITEIMEKKTGGEQI